jgi:hypothetical protein
MNERFLVTGLLMLGVLVTVSTTEGTEVTAAPPTKLRSYSNAGPDSSRQHSSSGGIAGLRVYPLL